MLAGAQELAAINPAPPRIAVCDEAAAALLAAAWPATELVRTPAPAAADALRFGAARVDAGVFVDLALLDGHYLRRPDAEIIGEAAEAAEESANPFSGILVRPMYEADLEEVMEIAGSLKDAPQWPRAAYVAALDREAVPRRIALVSQEKKQYRVTGFAVASLLAPQSELETIAVAAGKQRRGAGRRLLDEMVDKLKLEGAREINLEVRASNHAALGFYRATGWSETGRRPRYYADPIDDAVLLRLQLE
jgi:ribosomal protein S18 acetylase RimI-like enzyme